MLRFGLPTMPAELSLYALNVIDRVALVRLAGLAEAGLYALAVKFSQVVTVVVRAFNLAWPPLAYSIRSDDEARRAYSLVVTYYLLVSFTIVLALSLEARWVVRALAAPEFFDAYEAVPLVATGVTLYALYLVLSVAVGRVGRTEYNFPVTAVALAVNIGLNLVLIPPYGIVGAGIALVVAYLVMVGADVRGHAPGVPARPRVGAASRASSRFAAALFAGGELLLPDSGAVGLRLARGAGAGVLGAAVRRRGFFHAAELAAAARDPRTACARALSRLRGGAAGPRSPAQPRGADGRGARPPVARSAPRGRRRARPRGTRRRARSATRSIATKKVSRFTKPGNTSSWPRPVHRRQSKPRAARAGAPRRGSRPRGRAAPGRRPGARAPRAGTPASRAAPGLSRYRPSSTWSRAE